MLNMTHKGAARNAETYLFVKVMGGWTCFDVFCIISHTSTIKPELPEG